MASEQPPNVLQKYKGNNHESERSVVGKGRIYRNCRLDARQSGEADVKSIGITPPLRVSDLGCGDGRTAVPLALFGADVVGIDIARNLVDAGNKRVVENGLNRLKFQEGDGCSLERVSDHAFDLTLSVFGAMFAPSFP